MSIGIVRISTFEDKLLKPGVAIKIQDNTEYVPIPVYAIVSEVEPTRLRIHFYHNGVKQLITNDLTLTDLLNGHKSIWILN